MSPRIVLLIVLTAITAHAQTYRINALEAKGSLHETPVAICAASGLSVGQMATLDQVQAAANRLMQTGVFAELSYQHVQLGNGMRVTFTVKDKPENQFLPPAFDNLVWMTPAELDAELRKKLPLYTGVFPVGGGLRDKAVAVLEAALAAKGAPVHLQAMENQSAKGAYDSMLFSATDANITIEGFTFVAAADSVPPALEAELQQTARAMVGQGYSDQSVRGFTESTLRRPFLQAGMLKGSFGAPTVKVIDTHGTSARVHIDLPTSPGVVYRLAAFDITGNQAVAKDKLAAYFPVKVGQVADGVAIDAFPYSVGHLYREVGYLDASADLDQHLDDAAKAVSYQASVKEGQIYTAGELKLQNMGPKSVEFVEGHWKKEFLGKPYVVKDVNSWIASLPLPPNTTYKFDFQPDSATHSVTTVVSFQSHN